MKKFLFLLFTLTVSVSYGQFTITKDSEPTAPRIDTLARNEPKVYLCDSQTARAYHILENCKGLEQCTHRVIAVNQAAAERKRKPCKWCVQD
jgi:uncharacterized pyridoxamine 5'-phosphate oxidase family protein